MTTRRSRRDPFTRTVVRLPERDLAESILHLAAPLLENLGSSPRPDAARRAIELAIKLWNAQVTASKLWGHPRAKPLADLRKAVIEAEGVTEGADTFRLLADRWRQNFAFDPRLVGDWSYGPLEGERHRLLCETTLPDGVEAEVPPPAQQRIAIGGSFLDEVRIRQGAQRATYVLFPVEHHRGGVRDDGVATVYAKMPTVVQLFAEGRLPPIGGPSVDVAIGGKKLGPMVWSEVSCAGSPGWHDIAVLVFRSPGALVTR